MKKGLKRKQNLIKTEVSSIRKWSQIYTMKIKISPTDRSLFQSLNSMVYNWAHVSKKKKKTGKRKGEKVNEKGSRLATLGTENLK